MLLLATDAFFVDGTLPGHLSVVARLAVKRVARPLHGKVKRRHPEPSTLIQGTETPEYVVSFVEDMGHAKARIRSMLLGHDLVEAEYVVVAEPLPDNPGLVEVSLIL